MAEIGCGPLWRLDGPPPAAPPLGLLQAGDGASPLVRVNPVDGDAGGAERWLNGAEVHPYPDQQTLGYDEYQSGSDAATKEDGGAPPARPQFGPLTLYLPVRCSTFGVSDQAEFVRRATAALDATMGAAIEREFLNGTYLPLNPHLNDGEGLFPLADNTTNTVNALAVLENEIAKTGKAGIIHCSPAFATSASAHGVTIGERLGALRTINGTLVIPGAGYAEPGAPPSGHADPQTYTSEWVFATGPIDVRYTEAVVLPENVAEALDRQNNVLVYRVERHALVLWDATFKAAVLADRCQVDC